MPNKVKIAVSSCLLGEAVRYDGTDKHIKFITEQLALDYNLISLCPEMSIGMGVPRQPIHLVGKNNSIQVVGISEAENNFTKPLVEYGKFVVENNPNISGYIFKKNSPSCGTKNVKVMTISGEYERRGQGVYAATIMKKLPLLPVIDEEDLLNKKLMADFLFNVQAFSKQLL